MSFVQQYGDKSNQARLYQMPSEISCYKNWKKEPLQKNNKSGKQKVMWVLKDSRKIPYGQ